jgi:hypothetical protein
VNPNIGSNVIFWNACSHSLGLFLNVEHIASAKDLASLQILSIFIQFSTKVGLH